MQVGRIKLGSTAALAGALSLVLVTLMAIGSTAVASTEDIIAPSDPHDPQVDSGWQAGTCSEEPPESSDDCSVDTPDQFFEQAAGHPNWGFTQFIVRSQAPGETPIGEVKTIRVDLPVGLSVNPGATVQCPLATFKADPETCPGESKVGKSAVTVSLLGIPAPPTAPLSEVPVYNVEPVEGESARFGLELAGNEVFLEGDVDWSGDYHEGFTIHVPRATDLEPLIKGLVLKNRLVFNGRAGDGTFLTTPSTCLGEAFTESGSVYSTYLLASSYQEEEGAGYAFPGSAQPPLESPIPPGTSPKECETIPYDPAIAVDPKTAQVNSPSGPDVDLDIPHLTPDYGTNEDEQDTSPTRKAQVTLPAGMGINPSAATGLQVCTDAQFGKGTTDPVGCPPGSKIGTVEIESPPLPEEKGRLRGEVYVGQQLSRDPTSGQEYRIFVDAESPRYGISVRLVGNVSADPQTGQLTTTFDETPQVPVTSFLLSFDGGPRAVLSSPPTCGPNETTTVMTPWSANPAATPGDSFTLTVGP